jgi:hypothetical protein
MSVSRPALATDATSGIAYPPTDGADEVPELLHEILSQGILYGWSMPTSR